MTSHTLPRSLVIVWTACVLIFIYIPIVTVFIVAFTHSSYFSFPVKAWSLRWFHEMFQQYVLWNYHLTSLFIALAVTAIATVLGFFGALAFARYEWRGRRLYQKLILLPVFFPQAVLGLALLLWFSFLGILPDWKTAVFAHLVWIVPIISLVISIQVYGFDASQEDAARDLGAGRLRVFFDITLPALAPGLASGALFAFLLSWSNVPLSMFTSGADSTVPLWLLSKMATSYTPVVPAVGVVSILGAVALLSLIYIAATLRRGKP